MRRILPYLPKAIGVVIFVIILLKIDTKKALTNIQSASQLLLLLGFACFPIIYAIKTWRWHIMANAAGAKLTPFDSTIMYMSALFLGIVTPGKVGEAIKIPTLIARGLTTKDSIIVTVLDRIFDMALLGLMAIWAIGLLFSIELALGITITGLLLLGSVLLLKKILARVQKFILPHISQDNWIKAGALTVGNWVIFFVQFWLFANAFGIHIPATTFVAIVTIGGVISILPIAPAGLGTRDAALIYLMGVQGIASETVIAFSFTIFVLTLVASTIGAYFWIRYPMKLYAKT